MIHTALGSMTKFMYEHVKNASGVVQNRAYENFIVAVIGAGISPTLANCP